MTLPERARVGIGTLARGAGVPIPTIRTWERRYGFPRPERTRGGHRLYAPETVEQLRLVVRALDAGLRISSVINMPADELRRLLADLGTATALREGDDAGGTRPGELSRTGESPVSSAIGGNQSTGQSPSAGPSGEFLATWLQAAGDFDVLELERCFRSDLARLGTLGFVEERAVPFLREIGRLWSEGRLGVAQEHFASERLRDFLTEVWRPLASRNRGPVAVLTTLPQDGHELPLHLAACVLVLEGLRVVFFGTDTPIHDIVSTCRRFPASAFIVSVSSSIGSDSAELSLRRIRDGLLQDVVLVVGGPGAPRGIPGVIHLESLGDLTTWARQWNISRSRA